MFFENLQEGIVTNGSSCYVTSPETLGKFLQHIREFGYTVENRRESESKNLDIEILKKEGSYLWYAKLDLPEFRKCKSCGNCTPPEEMEIQDYRCKFCGEVMRSEIIDGTWMHFDFVKASIPRIGPLEMIAKRWDRESGYLYLYPEPVIGYFLPNPKQYLQENKDKWENVEEHGEKLIRIKFCSHPWIDRNSPISPQWIGEGIRNYDTVVLWRGKEYEKSSPELPPLYFAVYETWHSERLHTEILELRDQKILEKEWYEHLEKERRKRRRVKGCVTILIIFACVLWLYFK